MSGRKLHRVGADPSASRENALDYDTVRRAIAGDLSTSFSSTTPSAARLVGDLREEVQAFLDRGGTYRDAARIFENHGVEASPDAIRVALRRKANAPGDRMERKVVTSTPAAPESSLRVERPFSPGIPGSEEISPGSDCEIGEKSHAELTTASLSMEDGAFSASAPTSSEPLPGLRAPSIGRRPD